MESLIDSAPDKLEQEPEPAEKLAEHMSWQNETNGQGEKPLNQLQTRGVLGLDDLTDDRLIKEDQPD